MEGRGRKWKRMGMGGNGREKGEEGTGTGPQFEKNGPRHQMAGYGPVYTYRHTARDVDTSRTVWTRQRLQKG